MCTCLMLDTLGGANDGDWRRIRDDVEAVKSEMIAEP